MLSEEDIRERLDKMNIQVDWGQEEDPIKAWQQKMTQNFDWELWMTLIKQMIPSLSLKLKELDLPDIQQSNDTFDLNLNDIFLRELIFDTKNVNIDFKHDKKKNLKCLKLSFEDIRLTALNISFNFNKKRGMPKFTESGKLDLILPEKGLNIEVILELDPDLPQLWDKIKSFILAGKEPYSPGLGNGVEEDLFAELTNIDWEQQEIDIKEDIEIETISKNLNDELEADFKETFSAELFSEDENNAGTVNDDVEEDWMGDLTLLQPSLNVEVIKENDELIVNMENIKEESEMKQGTTEKEKEKEITSKRMIFWKWLKGEHNKNKTTRLDTDEEKNIEAKQEISVSETEKLSQVNNVQSNTIKTENTESIDQIISQQNTPQTIMQDETFGEEVNLENVSEVPTLPNNVHPNLPIDQVVSSLKILPKVYQLKAKIHGTQRDKLYRILTPLLNHILKRHLQNSIQQVIQKSISIWVGQLLVMAYEKFQSLKPIPTFPA